MRSASKAAQFLPVLAVLALLATAPGSVARGDELAPSALRLRALTYNVWALPHLLLRRPERLERIARELPGTGADFVALQETFHGRARVFAEIAEYPHVAHGPGATLLRSSSGLMLLSRHPLAETSTLVYRDCTGTDCLANKGALHARARLPGGAEVDVVTTHLNASDAGEVRERQLEQLIAFIDAIGERGGARPLLLLGDFNFPPDSPAYARLLAHLRVRDAYADNSGGGDPAGRVPPPVARAEPGRAPASRDGGPWAREGFTADPRRNTNLVDKARPSKRIDFAFVRAATAWALRTVAARLAFDKPVDGHHLSDHFGVLTELELHAVPAAVASAEAAGSAARAPAGDPAFRPGEDLGRATPAAE